MRKIRIIINIVFSKHYIVSVSKGKGIYCWFSMDRKDILLTLEYLSEKVSDSIIEDKAVDAVKDIINKPTQ